MSQFWLNHLGALVGSANCPLAVQMAGLLRKYSREASAWRPPFKCPVIEGFTAEQEALDDSILRDYDYYEGFKGSGGFSASAACHGLSGGGFDWESDKPTERKDLATRQGFIDIKEECKRVKPQGLVWWGVCCQLWGFAASSIHKRHGKIQFDKELPGQAYILASWIWQLVP